MQIYLVGGAVRDQLLGLTVKDRDWLVVGATPNQLIEQGFLQVGKDFPVFIHPETKEEYALARMERKNGVGYKGFVCDFSPNIRLEEDLLRRDLTINAIAQDSNGQLHDPYGGIADLNHRILRHISPAFSEDPLRVLRVARFAARYAQLGFKIAPETLALMLQMTSNGELSYLTAERVWMETCKALLTPTPAVYFKILREIGACRVLFPEIEALFGTTQRIANQFEVNLGIHTLSVLNQAVKLAECANDRLAVLVAALCHHLGDLDEKSIIPPYLSCDEKNETKGSSTFASFITKLKVPTAIQSFSMLVIQFHSYIHQIEELEPSEVIRLFDDLDVWRKPRRFADFLLVCEADIRGTLENDVESYPQRDYAWQLYQLANKVAVSSVIADGFEKGAIRIELQRRRIAILQQFKQRENLYGTR